MSNPHNKPRVVTDYFKLSEEIVEQIKLTYPYGYTQYLISFRNREGKLIKGLRFESEDKIYLIRMTEVQAEKIIRNDEDYDDEGNLIDDIKEEFEDKYPDIEPEEELDDD